MWDKRSLNVLLQSIPCTLHEESWLKLPEIAKKAGDAPAGDAQRQFLGSPVEKCAVPRSVPGAQTCCQAGSAAGCSIVASGRNRGALKPFEPNTPQWGGAAATVAYIVYDHS